MNKVGNIRANNIENPLSRNSISLGFILGDGLLGSVLEAAKKLRAASIDYGRGMQVTDRMEAAWLALFDALKEIEDICREGEEL